MSSSRIAPDSIPSGAMHWAETEPTVSLKHTQLNVSRDVAHFLGAFAKLRKATIRFVLSVCRHGTTH